MALFFDLSGGFDMVLYHKLLLQEWYQMGVRENPLNWRKSHNLDQKQMEDR